ncbi:hypothetical protein ACQ4PT_037420 [Festuca glaucescens]
MGSDVLLCPSIKIDDDTTAKHREELIKTPYIVPPNKQKPLKTDKGTTSSKTMPSSTDAASMEDMMGRMMKQKVMKMLNTMGVVYMPSRDNMSDNNDQEEVDKKEGMVSTRSHGLQPKDFMECDVVMSSDKASRSGSDKGVQDDSSSEKASWSGSDKDVRVNSFAGSDKEEPVDDANFLTRTEKKAMDGNDAAYTTLVNLGASADVPILIDENGSAALFTTEDATEGSIPLTPELIDVAVQSLRLTWEI